MKSKRVSSYMDIPAASVAKCHFKIDHVGVGQGKNDQMIERIAAAPGHGTQ